MNLLSLSPSSLCPNTPTCEGPCISRIAYDTGLSQLLRYSRFTAVFFATMLSLSSCLSYEPAQLIPELTLSGEQVEFGDEGLNGRQIDFGLIVGANESDSLFDLATLPRRQHHPR